MPDPAPPADQFWLLTGEVPTGPFTVTQIHEKIAAGDATWQTPACPVGGSKWLPLFQTPGIGPNADGADATPSVAEPKRPTPPPLPTPTPTPAIPHTPFTPAPIAASDAPAPSAEPPKSAAGTTSTGVAVWRPMIVLALIAVGVVGYWLYGAFRSPTAIEVCRKLDGAKTAEEAKKHVTARMHPLVDAEYAAGQHADPNTEFVFTQEVDGPKPDTKLVGFRGFFFLPEAGRRVWIEGHFIVVKSDGWKVDDMIVTGAEGVSLPGPVSLVEEYAPPATASAACRRLDRAKTAAEAKKYATARVYPLIDALAADKSAADPNDTFEITAEVDGGTAGTRHVGFRGSWYDPDAARRVRVEGYFRVVSAGGWKVDDMVFTGIEGVPLPGPMSLVTEHRRTAPPPPPSKSPAEIVNKLPIRSNPPVPKVNFVDQRPWYERYKYYIGGAVIMLLSAAGKVFSRRSSPPSRA